MNNQSLVKQASNVVEANSQIGSNQVSTSVQGAKALAEVQGKIIMAKQFPRDMTLVLNRVKASCERPSLAKVAEYQYVKGGTTVRGASIKLLEAVAQCYGNVQTNWKELSRDTINHKSLCIAEAWDLENNVCESLEFEVSHFRDKGGTRTLVTSERDIYELIASQAVRRQRKCLEFVIPRDIIDEARETCNTTLTKGIDIQAELNKVITFFNETYKVTVKQLETYFGMGRQGFNTQTYLSLRKLFQAFQDGVTTPEEIFPKETIKAKQTLVSSSIEVAKANAEQTSLFENPEE